MRWPSSASGNNWKLYGRAPLFRIPDGPLLLVGYYGPLAGTLFFPRLPKQLLRGLELDLPARATPDALVLAKVLIIYFDVVAQ